MASFIQINLQIYTLNSSIGVWLGIPSLLRVLEGMFMPKVTNFEASGFQLPRKNCEQIENEINYCSVKRRSNRTQMAVKCCLLYSVVERDVFIIVEMFLFLIGYRDHRQGFVIMNL